MRTAFLILAIIILGCSDEIRTSGCSTPATVVDLTGLDGCGFVFELEDGSRLEPVITGYCGTPPLPKEITENPLYNFEFRDGKKVMISYEEAASNVSFCQAGQMVNITCITDMSAREDL